VVCERTIIPTGLDSFESRHSGNFFWPILSLHKENTKAHEIPRLCHYVFHIFIAITDIHETWYDLYAIRVHPTTLRFNFLQKKKELFDRRAKP